MESTLPSQLNTPREWPGVGLHLRSVRTRIRTLALAGTVAVALAFRLFDLGAYGFSEDEINKVRAVERYRAFDVSANGEHPMLMKVAMLASTTAAASVNNLFGTGRQPISPEAALRLPNAVLGALSAAIIFLVVDILFDGAVAMWAALFWALDVNATAINRIGKEDTFLLAFLLIAVWCYERGRRRGAEDPVGAQQWYGRSGASFGLMLASKYMPHYLGLYGLFNRIADPQRERTRPNWQRFSLAMAIAFLVADAAVLAPATWEYIGHYLRGGTVLHHGYMFAGHLYTNNISHSPFGQPVYFYAVYFLTKVPLTMLTLALVGLREMTRRPRERGVIFLGVFMVVPLLGYSLIASKFLRYMLPVLAVLDIVAAVGLVAALRRLHERLEAGPRRVLAVSALACVAIAGPLTAQIGSAPFASLYQNEIGAAVAAPGSLFPTDELYDLGVRESIEAVARVARSGAVVASDASGVVRAYLDGHGRKDVRATSLSHDGLPMDAVDTWVVVHAGHLYFENLPMVEQLRSTRSPWRRVTIAGVRVVDIYRLPAARER